MAIPYVSIRWRGRRAFVICPSCKVEIELKERKDFESFTQAEYARHFEATHPEENIPLGRRA